MKFENTLVMNFENAMRGLRHPLESYAKSDSRFGISACDWLKEPFDEVYNAYLDKGFDKDNAFNFLENNGTIRYNEKEEIYEYAFIGPNDLDLAQRMIKAGNPNDKFLRQVLVSVDITAPLYFFKEFDTYKVATVANSTSTMHKLASTPITIDCFEIDDYVANLEVGKWAESTEYEPYSDEAKGLKIDEYIKGQINFCERLRQLYLETKDIRYWKELIRWLPESWLQTRAWSANYATLRGIYHWRKDHRLSEWHQFCDWIAQLPYANELLLFEN